MRILQLCVSSGVSGGGVGRIVSRIDQILKHHGFKSEIAECGKEQISCRRFPGFSSVVFPSGLEEFVRRFDPDILFSHGYSSTIPLFGHSIAGKLGKRHFLAVHAYPKGGIFRNFLMHIYNAVSSRMLRDSEKVFFSSSAKRVLGGSGKLVMFKPEKMFFSAREKRSGEYLLFVGRLDENKRAEMFVRICSLLGEKGLIVGFDEGAGRVARKEIEKTGAEVKIISADFHQMPKIYAKAKALVCCSEYEGLPLVWLEAIASGVPVFTTPVGDYKEILSLCFGSYEKFSFSTESEASIKIKNYFSLPDRDRRKIELSASQSIERIDFEGSILSALGLS